MPLLRKADILALLSLSLDASSSFVFSGSRKTVGADGDCNCIGSLVSQALGAVSPAGEQADTFGCGPVGPRDG